MEPSFKTGDLAIVKPAGQYRVGDIVAYHSSLLHIVVLHRIHAIHDGRYTFKGDNNSFLDPVHPTRSALIGKLWLHFPHGGVFLTALHTPITAGVLIGVAGLLLLRGLLRQARTPAIDADVALAEYRQHQADRPLLQPERKRRHQRHHCQ